MTKRQKSLLYKLFIILMIVIVILSYYLYINSNNKIVIATKNLTEQRIVAYMLKEVIQRDTDYEVVIKSGMDATSFLHNAIVANDIDMYIEYSSVSFLEVFKQEYKGQSSDEILTYIKEKYPKEYDVSWYTTLGFDNSNVIICKSYCEKNNIDKLSQITLEDELTFGAPLYFFDRSDGYNLMENTYAFGSNVKTKNLDPVLVYSAVNSGDLDLGLAFSTDGKMSLGNYTLIEDDLNAFPIYDAGIIVNNNSLKKYPELKEILNSFNELFSNKVIQKVNYEVESGKYTAIEEAHKLIVEMNL